MRIAENAQLREFLRSVVQLLVNGEYSALERMSNGNRLSAKEMSEAVSDYGRTLVMPMHERFDSDIIPISESEPQRWSVVLPLCSVEEGGSDLSFEIKVIANNDGSFGLETEDLHVR